MVGTRHLVFLSSMGLKLYESEILESEILESEILESEILILI